MTTTAIELPPLRLLVIDRTPVFPDAVRELASSLSWEVVLCQTLEGGLAEINRFRPQVIIVDPDVCELGNIGIVRTLELVAPRSEVVVLSIDPVSQEGLETVRAGALECMTKCESLLRLRELLPRIASRVGRLERLPREVGVALKLDGESALRYGRFTKVEHRVA